MRRAARLLLARMTGKILDDADQLMPVTLIPRATTGPTRVPHVVRKNAPLSRFSPHGAIT
jgi:hypothetical protein